MSNEFSHDSVGRLSACPNHRARMPHLNIWGLGFLTLSLLLLPIAVHLSTVHAADAPTIPINTATVQPRPLEDSTAQSISRVYTKAWTDLDRALSNNDASALNAAFIGFARERYAKQISDQLKAGMSAHLTASNHNAAAVFYGIEGSSMEIRDTVQLERQVLDNGKIIATMTETVPFVAVLTVVDDGWKVRILEQAQP